MPLMVTIVFSELKFIILEPIYIEPHKFYYEGHGCKISNTLASEITRTINRWT